MTFLSCTFSGDCKQRHWRGLRNFTRSWLQGVHGSLTVDEDTSHLGRRHFCSMNTHTQSSFSEHSKMIGFGSVDSKDNGQ